MNQTTINEGSIMNYLDRKGFKHSIKGFRFLIKAIDLCVQDSNKLYSICNLYKEIAENYNTTPSKVECAIRHSIEVSGNKLTNSEFIARASDFFIYQ
jgi:two-component system response regulator (stage 0 sporulation protein A)